MAKLKPEGEKVISVDTGDTGENPSRPPGGDPATEQESALAAEAAKLRAEKEELLQTLVRRQADFENFRKRTERDRQEEGRRGVERMIADLIPVLDALDRGILAHEDPGYEEYRKGVTLIRKQLWDALARHGVQMIDAEGKMFDPHVHQAVERTESTEHPDGLILHVFQNGYVFHGRVLRPAIVRVVVNSEAAEN